MIVVKSFLIDEIQSPYKMFGVCVIINKKGFFLAQTEQARNSDLGAPAIPKTRFLAIFILRCI